MTPPDGNGRVPREMSERWRAAAAFRLGVRWQKAGMLERAAAAYEEVLRYFPDHQVSRFNLGVTLLRMGRHAEGLAVLDDLAESLKLPLDDPARWTSDASLSIGYNRAIGLHLTRSAEQGAELSHAVLERILERLRRGGEEPTGAPQTTAERLELPAAMLHAHLHLAAVEGTAKDRGPLAANAIRGALMPKPPRVTRSALLAQGLTDPAQLEWYARRFRESNARASYDYARYLTDLLPRANRQERPELRRRAADVSTIAIREPQLKSWMAHDPTMQPGVSGIVAEEERPLAAPPSQPPRSGRNRRPRSQASPGRARPRARHQRASGCRQPRASTACAPSSRTCTSIGPGASSTPCSGFKR